MFAFAKYYLGLLCQVLWMGLEWNRQVEFRKFHDLPFIDWNESSMHSKLLPWTRIGQMYSTLLHWTGTGGSSLEEVMSCLTKLGISCLEVYWFQFSRLKRKLDVFEFVALDQIRGVKFRRFGDLPLIDEVGNQIYLKLLHSTRIGRVKLGWCDDLIGWTRRIKFGNLMIPLW